MPDNTGNQSSEGTTREDQMKIFELDFTVNLVESSTMLNFPELAVAIPVEVSRIGGVCRLECTVLHTFG